jgi:glycine cleavage system H protein
MKFTETHEWIDATGDLATVGITHYAQQELGDIVYVELPQIGKNVKAGEEAAVLESTKAAADIYSPASGTIVEVNEKLKTDSGLINASALKDGWLFKLKLSHPQELNTLMDEAQYLNLVK